MSQQNYADDWATDEQHARACELAAQLVHLVQRMEVGGFEFETRGFKVMVEHPVPALALKLAA